MSLNDEEFGSGSDTDDDDYVPDGDGHAASEEENSGDDENAEVSTNTVKVTKKKKNKPALKAPAGRASMFDNEDKIDWSKEQAKEKENLNEAAEKKKTDDIWADFKKDTASSNKTNQSRNKPTNSIASLFSNSPVAESSKTETVKPKSRFGSIFDSCDTSKNDKVPSTETVSDKARSRFSDLFDTPTEETNKVDSSGANSSKEPIQKGGKVEITKVFDFAGEEVKVSKQVDADSKEATKFLAEASNPQTVKRPGGLASVVGSITKKPKMGCLDKSKLDWNNFVTENNIKEELKTHNMGKDGYVEKLQFLERADLRQFEQEKALREKTRKSLMK